MIAFFLESFSSDSSDPSFSGEEEQIEVSQFEATRQINLRQKIIKSKCGITEKFVKQGEFRAPKLLARKNIGTHVVGRKNLAVVHQLEGANRSNIDSGELSGIGNLSLSLIQQNFDPLVAPGEDSNLVNKSLIDSSMKGTNMMLKL